MPHATASATIERMDLYEVMSTTFAAREFTDEPVADEVLARILDHARFAPSGGNRQGWHVIVVRDAEKRKRLGELIRPTMQRYRAQVEAGESPFNTIEPSGVDEATVARTEPPHAMIERVVGAPVLLLVTVDLARVASFDAALPRVGVISGASIYPFVWNLLLAARNEGLGGTLTTMLTPAEAEVRALFGIPERHAVAALLPIGRPVRQLTRLRRAPVERFATIDHFEGEAFAAKPR